MLFLTSNESKFEEAEQILCTKLERKNLNLDEIQAIEVEEVIEHKLDEAYRKLKKPLFVEDTGLFIQSWNRLPGALTKFFMKALGNEGICEMIQRNRKASAETYVGYTDGENRKIFKGVVEGKISETPRGEGFGWDAIFQPDGYQRTFGEMTKKEKNKISMRKRALEKFSEWIGKQE